jgi:hypothetical protein
MKIALLLLLPGVVALDDPCASLVNCSACAEVKGCGWCNGQTYDEKGKRAPCVPLDSSSQWKCDGEFKTTKQQCSCTGTDVPDELLHEWRGFYVDKSLEGEVVFTFSNTGKQGRISVLTTAGAKQGNVTAYKECPKNSLVIDYDDGTREACTYRLNWQSGGDAWTLSLGCDDGAAPEDFDEGQRELELFTCNPFADHCPFGKRMEKSEVGTETPGGCEELTSCAACSAKPACNWCLGRLVKDGKAYSGVGHCFGGEAESGYKCDGVTLDADCTVYKCPWYEYYATTPPNCTALSSTCNAPTTADDPDFYRQFVPATGFASSELCASSCVDPTIGCTSQDKCERTYTCNPSSNCSSCTASNLPAVLQGIEISANFTRGIWTFAFTQSEDRRSYTSVKITSPAGEVSTYDVRSWTGTTATFASGATLRGARFDGLHESGALGYDVYIALGDRAEVPGFGPVMFNGGSEFALLACEYDETGKRTVSGQGKPIDCKVGQL